MPCHCYGNVLSTKAASITEKENKQNPSCCWPDKRPYGSITNGNNIMYPVCRSKQMDITGQVCPPWSSFSTDNIELWSKIWQDEPQESNYCQNLCMACIGTAAVNLMPQSAHRRINYTFMFLETSSAGVQWQSKWLRFHLKRLSNTLCVGGLHLQLTFWKAVTCWQGEQQGDKTTARVSSLADAMVTGNCSQHFWESLDFTSQCMLNANARTTLCYSSGAQLHHSESKIHPSLCSSTPTDGLCFPPSCHTTHKNEVRSGAHIRRAGGSTLSGVRNNSFWPSPACAQKWSPWVAAYQRAAANEWVVGITQPGFRTYTGHSKGRAHWAREMHGKADSADHVLIETGW